MKIKMLRCLVKLIWFFFSNSLFNDNNGIKVLRNMDGTCGIWHAFRKAYKIMLKWIVGGLGDM